MQQLWDFVIILLKIRGCILHTVRNLHFLSKNSTSGFFGWKTRENVVVLDFLAVDNFDFTGKIVDFFGVKNRENVVVLDYVAVEKLVKLNFWTKIWLFEKCDPMKITT